MLLFIEWKSLILQYRCFEIPLGCGLSCAPLGLRRCSALPFIYPILEGSSRMRLTTLWPIFIYIALAADVTATTYLTQRCNVLWPPAHRRWIAKLSVHDPKALGITIADELSIGEQHYYLHPTGSGGSGTKSDIGHLDSAMEACGPIGLSVHNSVPISRCLLNEPDVKSLRGRSRTRAIQTCQRLSPLVCT